jgi:hypothetical protein
MRGYRLLWTNESSGVLRLRYHKDTACSSKIVVSAYAKLHGVKDTQDCNPVSPHSQNPVIYEI